jgi:hypothetical protein
MNRIAVGLGVLSLLAMSVLPAHAKIRWAQINGNVSKTTDGAACTEPGYDNQCPSGQCSCVQVSNATLRNVDSQPSLAGTGTANVFLTFDTGAEMPTTAGIGICIPFFGIAKLTTALATETLNLVGVNCDPVNTADQPVLGGFGISKQPAPIPLSKGFGKMTGFLDGSILDSSSTGVLSLTLQGPVRK